MIKYLKWFMQFWRQHRFKMLGVTLLTIVTITAKTAFPLFLKAIIDQLNADYQLDVVYQLVFLFAAFAVFESLCSNALPLFSGYLNMLYAVMVRNKYYGIFTEKNAPFFQKFRTGDLLTRLTDDVDGDWLRIHWYACSGILRPLEAICILGFTLSIMSFYSWKLTLFTALPLPFLVYIMSKIEGKMFQFTKEKQEATSRCNNILESCFSGIRVVKTTLSERQQLESYQEALTNRKEKEKEKVFLKLNQQIHFFAMLVNYTGSIIVIFFGSLFLIKGQITLGTLLLFITYSQKLIEPIWTISMFYVSSKQIFRYVDRLIETEDSEGAENRVGLPQGPTSPPAGQDSKKIPQFESLELQNISFQYPNTKVKALDNISFKVKQGQT